MVGLGPFVTVFRSFGIQPVRDVDMKPALLCMMTDLTDVKIMVANHKRSLGKFEEVNIKDECYR